MPSSATLPTTIQARLGDHARVNAEAPGIDATGGRCRRSTYVPPVTGVASVAIGAGQEPLVVVVGVVVVGVVLVPVLVPVGLVVVLGVEPLVEPAVVGVVLALFGVFELVVVGVVLVPVVEREPSLLELVPSP
ncbi:MAG TPA: hypothetical protein VGF81_04440 [Solirubrobacteraceae bacterium]